MNIVPVCIMCFLTSPLPPPKRRDYRVLAECLPPKQEYVVSIRMSPLQDCLYRKFLDEGRTRELADLFSTFSSLLKVCTQCTVVVALVLNY